MLNSISLWHTHLVVTQWSEHRERTDLQLQKERRKKYSNQQHPGSCKATFIPLIFEHFGCWGEMADNYLNQLTKRSRDVESGLSEAQFRGQWRKRLSICLQKSNSNVVLRKLRRITEGNEELDDNERDIQTIIH